MPRNDMIALQGVSEDDHLEHSNFVVACKPYDDESKLFYVMFIRSALSPSFEGSAPGRPVVPMCLSNDHYFVPRASESTMRNLCAW